MDEVTRICAAIRHALAQAESGPVSLADYLEICRQMELAKMQILQRGRFSETRPPGSNHTGITDSERPPL